MHASMLGTHILHGVDGSFDSFGLIIVLVYARTAQEVATAGGGASVQQGSQSGR